MNKIIKLYIGSVVRYAQNRSETFDASRSVCKLADAKRFPSKKHVRGWLKRNGFTKRYSPAPFTGFEVVAI